MQCLLTNLARHDHIYNFSVYPLHAAFAILYKSIAATTPHGAHFLMAGPRKVCLKTSESSTLHTIVCPSPYVPGGTVGYRQRFGSGGFVREYLALKLFTDSSDTILLKR